jgi:hypothetical protein
METHSHWMTNELFTEQYRVDMIFANRDILAIDNACAIVIAKYFQSQSLVHGYYLYRCHLICSVANAMY